MPKKIQKMIEKEIKNKKGYKEGGPPFPNGSLGLLEAVFPEVVWVGTKVAGTWLTDSSLLPDT